MEGASGRQREGRQHREPDFQVECPWGAGQRDLLQTFSPCLLPWNVSGHKHQFCSRHSVLQPRSGHMTAPRLWQVLTSSPAGRRQPPS